MGSLRGFPAAPSPASADDLRELWTGAPTRGVVPRVAPRPVRWSRPRFLPPSSPHPVRASPYRTGRRQAPPLRRAARRPASEAAGTSRPMARSSSPWANTSAGVPKANWRPSLSTSTWSDEAGEVVHAVRHHGHGEAARVQLVDERRGTPRAPPGRGRPRVRRARGCAAPWQARPRTPRGAAGRPTARRGSCRPPRRGRGRTLYSAAATRRSTSSADSPRLRGPNATSSRTVAANSWCSGYWNTSAHLAAAFLRRRACRPGPARRRARARAWGGQGRSCAGRACSSRCPCARRSPRNSPSASVKSMSASAHTASGVAAPGRRSLLEGGGLFDDAGLAPALLAARALLLAARDRRRRSSRLRKQSAQLLLQARRFDVHARVHARALCSASDSAHGEGHVEMQPLEQVGLHEHVGGGLRRRPRGRPRAR